MPATPDRIESVIAVSFGDGGGGTAHQGDGWSSPEAGFCWTTGPRSFLRIPFGTNGPTQAVYFLELRLNPFTVPWRLDGQSLRIAANGVPVAQDKLIRTCTVAYKLPQAAILAAAQSGFLELAFSHPDFARPSDFGASEDERPLGFMMYALRVVRLPATEPADMTALPPLALPRRKQDLEIAVAQASGLDPATLLRFFESLGQSCEFGLVQRHMGAEPLGMLRFAGIDLQDLLDGLQQDFAGVGDGLHVEAIPTAANTAEFMVKDLHYRIGFHTFTDSSKSTAESVHALYLQHVRFLHRTFMRRLHGARHIFVFQRPHVILTAEARALHLRLQTLADNALLYVDQSPGLPNGAVEQLDHGLYHGKLDHLAPPDRAGDADLPSWLSVCLNAYRFWR